MAYSISSAGDSRNMLPARLTSQLSYQSRSEMANEPTSRAESKMETKKGKSAGLVNRIRFRFWGRKEKPVDKVDLAALMDREEEIDASLRRYSYEELQIATEGFSPKRIIGKGGSGVVYKGILKCDTNGGDDDRSSSMIDVAVKMIVGGSEHRRRDYITEIKVIGRLHHPNLVKLLGYCHEEEHLLLVHEFMPNGGLSSHLYRSELRPLPWEVRYHRIVAGLTSALSYLQNGWERCVVHRDIKPSNILLDSNFNPKLTDFELARVADAHDSELDITTVVAGTRGYLAPEFIIRGKFSKESDIYAFGVVLLEIACGRRPVDKSRGGMVSLMYWVRDLDNKGKILEAADPRLGNSFNKQEMKRLLDLGLLCTHDEPHCRPSIEAILMAFKNSTMPPRDLLPKEDMSSIAPTTAQQGMMPYFLSDVEDYTTICFELTSTAAAEFAGGTTVQANTVESARSSSTISELDREPASRASSNTVLISDSEKQGLEDHQLELEAENGCWDIGIPPVYLSAGDSPMKDHHQPVINGLVASLHTLLRSEDKPLEFDEVLKSIKIYTSCLVSVGAPLVEWNSLAQQVLRVTKMMNAFPSLIAPDPTTAATLSSLRANVNECAHAVDNYEAISESVNKQLALARLERLKARREHLALMARIAKLEKQIQESEEKLSSAKQTAAQRRELQGKLSAILNQYESTLSKLSSFRLTPVEWECIEKGNEPLPLSNQTIRACDESLCHDDFQC